MTLQLNGAFDQALSLATNLAVAALVVGSVIFFGLAH